MRVAAPGKLVLTGAYAVLHGAPAVVVGVDRLAFAEVARPDDVDVRALHDARGVKLGLGSSAAARVVAAGARVVAQGGDLANDDVRQRVFDEARAAHAGEQQGGSGVDVAAATWGGALVYLASDPASGRPRAERAGVPAGLELRAYFSGAAARTSELRARVDAARARRPGAGVFERLHDLAERAAESFARGDAGAFVGRARDFGAALEELGALADAPIVPPAFAELARLAARAGAAFLPSGAGGGDTCVWLGTTPPSPAFSERAAALAMTLLNLHVDPLGVRLLP